MVRKANAEALRSYCRATRGTRQWPQRREIGGVVSFQIIWYTYRDSGFTIPACKVSELTACRFPISTRSGASLKSERKYPSSEFNTETACSTADGESNFITPNVMWSFCGLLQQPYDT